MSNLIKRLRNWPQRDRLHLVAADELELVNKQRDDLLKALREISDKHAAYLRVGTAMGGKELMQLSTAIYNAGNKK